MLKIGTLKLLSLLKTASVDVLCGMIKKLPMLVVTIGRALLPSLKFLHWEFLSSGAILLFLIYRMVGRRNRLQNAVRGVPYGKAHISTVVKM